MIQGGERRIGEILSEERALHEAYIRYLPHLRSPTLHEKFRTRPAEGEKHIRALESALGRPAEEDRASLQANGPSDRSTHSILHYFYEGEEKLYYLYLGALKRPGELGSLLESHLQDQKRHIEAIQNLYAESLYY